MDKNDIKKYTQYGYLVNLVGPIRRFSDGTSKCLYYSYNSSARALARPSDGIGPPPPPTLAPSSTPASYSVMGSEYLLHAGSASWGQVLGSHQEQCPAGSWDGLLGHSQPTVQVVPANNDTLLDAPLGSVFHGTTLSSGTLHRQDRFSYTSFSRMAHGHTSSTVCCPKPGQAPQRCN